MSWLIVAKMPLLISSRMTSATLTPSSSASSLTVMVPGSSIAPRSLGSTTCTGVVNWLSRRCGLRGPRRPRVPLLLLATGSSFDGVRVSRSRRDALDERRRQRDLQRPTQGALLDGDIQTIGVPADVGPPTGKAAGRVVDDLAGGRTDDPPQVTLGSCRSTRHARPRRDPSWGIGRRRVGRGRGYDVTSSAVSASVAGVATSAVAASAASPVPLPLVAAAAFFVRFGLAGAASVDGSVAAPSAGAASAATALVRVRFGLAGVSAAGASATASEVASAVGVVAATAAADSSAAGAVASTASVSVWAVASSDSAAALASATDTSL